MDYTDYFLSNEQLLEVLSFSTDATAIHVSEDAVIQYANKAMLAIWGKGQSVLGKSLEDALPELKGQPFIEMFKKVWNEGLTIKGNDTAAELLVDGKLQTFYFDFEYRALKNEQGQSYAILHMAKDITEVHLSKKREQGLIEELRALNEELLAANEEIRAANEEMAASNEELSESQQELMALYRNLSDSNSYFRSMVRQAPVGICIINANNLIVQDVNYAYLEIVGKPRDEFEGRMIWDAIPEAASSYALILQNVIKSGIPFSAKENELLLVRNGVEEHVFFDFVYEPMLNNDVVQAIMVLTIEVTDKVIARRSIEDVEERIRLAVEAAEIGTFDLDLVNNTMLTSERFDAIFGFYSPQERHKYTEAIQPDDKDTRNAAHNNALSSGKLFYEVRIIHPDATVHWIRAQGSVYYDRGGQPLRMLGTLLDITQFKRLEQQKDDFISIASHELKTPITSLKASLQLLDKLKETPTAPVVPKLIDQSLRSMEKISTLVEDLLNVSRTQQSQLKLNKTDFVIADMLNGCCNHIRVAGKYTLTVKGEMQLKIHADEHAIDQVVVNLVNNAVKYAPESLEIIMMVEKIGDHAKISIQDSGPGVAPDKIPHLFDRYFQAQASGFNNSGLGLGLYICAEIVRRHGGKIGVDSELGRGSTFWFMLPLA